MMLLVFDVLPVPWVGGRFWPVKPEAVTLGAVVGVTAVLPWGSVTGLVPDPVPVLVFVFGFAGL